MKHLKKVSARVQSPQKAAMDTTLILYIVGSVFTGLGSILIGISSTLDPKLDI
ncbi:MAG: hypothetical protein GX117_07425 [Candidatus Hydrogenedentes bacterium]|jgi:hypothetical protein|nr:hypothetical protein [Candidatus Hydrogenedentota bacterium]